MIRFVVILLASILLISVVRSIVGVILKAFAEMVGGGTSGATTAGQRPNQEIPLAGELKRDPVCGTFVSTASSVKKTVAGQVVHFCSVECRDRHKV
jgi:YHS domain-containing protein